MKQLLTVLGVFLLIVGCNESKTTTEESTENQSEMKQKLSKYVSVKLTSELAGLSENQRQMLPILIEAADKMNALFWYEAYGDQTELLNSINDAETKKFVEINYGPWDRLDGNKPFVEGVGEKPAGANFYPADMTKEEFENAEIDNKSSIYNQFLHFQTLLWSYLQDKRRV